LLRTGLTEEFVPEDPKNARIEDKTEPPAESLSVRAQKYRDEIERVVRDVGEHPLYELKRAYDFSSLRQRIEFVKDIQSIATSHIDDEKFLVIGADEATRKFVAVTNSHDFEDTKVRQQLEKYLSPCPRFEVLPLKTSDGVPFLLFVIRRQPTRRILARVTVDDPSEQKPHVLLREGDLWTKGDSTGKRLGKPEDWDAIYEDAIEREAESRTRTRTDHIVQQVITQERIRAVSGSSFAVPAYLNDEEFKLIAEDICARGDNGRLSVSLERLRDDLIERWHEHESFDPNLFQMDPRIIPEYRRAAQAHRDNVFRPAMQRLVLLLLSIVKNRGSIALFEQSLALLCETYNASHRLDALRLSTPRGSRSIDLDGHLSHTSVALESLIAIHIVGAYIAKRRRFGYFRPLMAVRVFMAGKDVDQHTVKYPMAMWPLHPVWGEPEGLRYRAGRIDLCVAKIMRDTTIAGFFGNEESAREALIQFEFLVELNSFLAVDSRNTPETARFLRDRYPEIDFGSWPSLIAFDLRYVTDFASEIFTYFSSGSTAPLPDVLIDVDTAKVLGTSGQEVYLRFLRTLQDAHEKLMFELNRFPAYVYWPKRIQDALNALPRGR
jgi:hypothetical protein